MIPVCFPEEVTFGYDNHTTIRCLPFNPEMRDGSTVLDPHRIYLVMEETLEGTRADALRSGRPQPVELKTEIFDLLPRRPVHVSRYLDGPPGEGVPSRLRICLMNGGGGGLGDGIMFAPALRILARRLMERCGAVAEMDVFTLYPLRTASVLCGIPGLQVKGAPLSLAGFMEYDAYVDFSGMLKDPVFADTHMTDFVLQRMGIDPASVPADEKAPLLFLPPDVPAEVEAALALAGSAAAGRPLVGVIFKSAYTRSMPDPQAAALIGRLAGAHLPVLLLEDPRAAVAFIRQYGLHGRVFDLSPVSTSLLHYFHLLAGLDAIVSVDTSAVHIGAGLGKPTVGIFNSIDRNLRICYSPTVKGIQLAYRGRECQAPCGLSKSRAYVEGQLPTGRPVRLECGYACDEAVDKEAILKETIAALHRLTDAGSDADALERIRQQMVDRLHAALAPCWKALDLEQVAGLLETVMDEGRRAADPCPICGAWPPHACLGEIGQQADVFVCPCCEGSFWVPKGSGDSLPGRAYLPEIFPEEIRTVEGMLRAVGGNTGPVLALGDERWCAAAGEGREDRLAMTLLPWPLPENFAGPDLAECRVLVLLACLDDTRRPFETLEKIVRRLRSGATVMLLSRHRQAWGQNAGPALGWTLHTHRRFHRRIGMEILWAGTTPICRNTCLERAGKIPPLTIQPPLQKDVTIQLEGRELAEYVGGFMAQVLQNARGNGRFAISIGRKKEKD